eukprot:CAMPEP_0181385806 /NCGR_PEP_ID=MMETSP1106-20121128/22771_1 /TAXON_ID=81844 /ORGANISM="Mantoniella antarctica, Strain SL-175" /LENGTH=63 /DNA_ID=CAMNT_0023505921 /DNA_START=44 /DNA_END=232 /DNA_ORIENTATION=-
MNVMAVEIHVYLRAHIRVHMRMCRTDPMTTTHMVRRIITTIAGGGREPCLGQSLPALPRRLLY